MLHAFYRTALLAADLKSAECINWHALENFLQKNGKEKTLALLNEEKKGANDIYKLHLDLAINALNEKNI